MLCVVGLWGCLGRSLVPLTMLVVGYVCLHCGGVDILLVLEVTFLCGLSRLGLVVGVICCGLISGHRWACWLVGYDVDIFCAINPSLPLAGVWVGCGWVGGVSGWYGVEFI